MSARVPECQTLNGGLGLYGAERSKCNRMMTLGFKGLMAQVVPNSKFFNTHVNGKGTQRRLSPSLTMA